MPVVPSSGSEVPDPKKDQPEKQEPTDLAQVRGPRKQVVFHVNIGSFNEQDYSRLQFHARALNMSVEELARKKVLAGLELPPRSEKLTPEQGAVAIKGEWRTRKTDSGESSGFYLQVQLDKTDRAFIKAWAALLTGMTDHYHISFLQPVEHKTYGHLVPFCLYPGNEEHLTARLEKSGITSSIAKLPVIDSEGLDVMPRVAIEAKQPRPIVYGIPIDRVLRLIEGSEPTLTKIKEQIKEARRQHQSAFKGIDITNVEFPSLNEDQVRLLDTLSRMCTSICERRKK